MKFVKTLLACAALAAAAGAQAEVVTYTPGGPLGQFLTLNDSGLAASGSFAGATRAGGTVYSVDMPLADQPKGS
ncbi:MAG: hypothetical protein M3Y67_02085, partial [Pseudomonadota bacterium]|nr:hypothetical protein [Pseudomonadota bacterium]